MYSDLNQFIVHHILSKLGTEYMFLYFDNVLARSKYK